MKLRSIAAAAAVLLSAVSVWAQSPSLDGPATALDQDARRARSEAESRARAAPDSTLTFAIYGLIDAGAEYITGSSGSLKRMPSLTGTQPSRLGVRGVEDLGDGLRAFFVLEQGFSPDTGVLNQGVRGFGRQSMVGLSGGWGTFSLGRQYTMLFWSLLDASVLGPNIYGIPSLDSYIPNARADNAIVYRGTFSGLTLGASYSFGRDAVNAGPSPSGTNCPGEGTPDSKACREWSAMLKYDAPRWGAALAIDELRGGPGAFAGLISSTLTDRRVSVNGYVKVGEGQIGGGLIRRDNQANKATPRSDIWYLGATYPIIPLLTLDAEVSRLSYSDSPNEATIAAIRATYFLSKRTALYVTAGNISNEGTLAISVSGGAPPGLAPKSAGSQTGVMTGMRHSF